MKQQTEKAEALLALIREGKSLTFGQQLKLTAQLSIPSIVAQLSSIVMQYIDASMVGSLGADASASIGLVSTTTWLFGGLCMSRSPTASGRTTSPRHVPCCVRVWLPSGCSD